MAMKQTGRKLHKSMQGKSVDMDLLRQRNELTPAVGNARVNARGDQLGPGGQIIRKRDEILDEYYKDHPQAVADEVPNKPVQAVEPEVQVEAVKAPAKKAVKSSTSKVEEEMKAIDQEADAWVEDSDGNFVQKGD
jgi:hypothetical protein